MTHHCNGPNETHVKCAGITKIRQTRTMANSNPKNFTIRQ